MNILYVGNFVFPDKSPGALKVFSFAKIFEKLGHSVDFASTLKGDNDSKMKKYRFNSFCVYSIEKKQSTKGFIKKIYDVDLFKKVVSLKDYSLIIAYNPQSIANLRMSRWCKKNGIKYICDIDEWDEPSPQYNRIIRFCVRFNIYLNMKYSNKKADGLILSSDYLNKYYHKMHTIVCPPLVDINEKKWQVNKFEKIDSEHTFVYFGSGGSVKEDLVSIIENFEQLNRFDLNVVGLTQETYEKDYNIKHKNYKKVKFWGRVEHKNALQIVANSDCSIILRKPTRKNNAGFPTKFVESISLGIPVLCNDFSDVKKHIENKKNGKILQLNNIKNELLHFFDENIEVNCEEFDISNYVEDFNQFLIDL